MAAGGGWLRGRSRDVIGPPPRGVTFKPRAARDTIPWANLSARRFVLVLATAVAGHDIISASRLPRRLESP